MFWPWEVVEPDHEIQNPVSPEKIRLLGEYLRLTGESRVLDLACGKGGPAAVLAAAFGCRVLGIEIRPAFAEEARRRTAAEGLQSLVEVETADASALEIEPESFDAVLCLGAAFVWGTIADAAAAVRPAVRGGGFAAIGEPFWRQWPLPETIEAEGFVGLNDTVARFAGAGFAVRGLVAASEDDWDGYEPALARNRGVAGENPGHQEAEDVLVRHERFRSEYFAFKRALLGWAIFVGRKI